MSLTTYNRSDCSTLEVGVAKLRKPALGRHRSYRDAIIIIQNTFILAIFMQNLFGHGKTMTALCTLPNVVTTTREVAL